MPKVKDNDWPEEVQGLRRIPEVEARKLSHDPILGTQEGMAAEHKRQLSHEKEHGHPAMQNEDDDRDR